MPRTAAVFRRNADEHPRSSNAFDGLGDGYRAAGDARRAAESYRRAVALDPRNRHAVMMLRQLAPRAPAQPSE